MTVWSGDSFRTQFTETEITRPVAGDHAPILTWVKEGAL